MDLSDEFEVSRSLEEAWSVLTDLERVAPCLPGAQLDEIEGDEYRGRVRVKVGPITVEYRGAAHFVRRDEPAHVAELRAEGRETRGQGSASATVRATLQETADRRTRVAVETTLDVSGRVAQLGRGALADVSTRLLRQFVANLEQDLAASSGDAPETARDEAGTARDEAGTDGALADEASAATAGEAASAGGAPQSDADEPRVAEPISAFRVVGPVLLKRLGLAVVVGALALVLRRLLGSRRA